MWIKCYFRNAWFKKYLLDYDLSGSFLLFNYILKLKIWSYCNQF